MLTRAKTGCRRPTTRSSWRRSPRASPCSACSAAAAGDDAVGGGGRRQLSRATARRILRTLAELGYVEQHGRQFSLAPNILELGFAYLATQTWIDRAVPLMKD